MSNKKLLIVDDSKLARMMIRTIVEENYPEIEIQEAANADEALVTQQTQTFEYMTIDFNMPGMNGLELAEQLKDSHPDAKIYLLTANIQDAIRNKATDLGIDFIPKPINEEKVTSVFAA